MKSVGIRRDPSEHPVARFGQWYPTCFQFIFFKKEPAKDPAKELAKIGFENIAAAENHTYDSHYPGIMLLVLVFSSSLVQRRCRQKSTLFIILDRPVRGPEMLGCQGVGGVLRPVAPRHRTTSLQPLHSRLGLDCKLFLSLSINFL